MPGRLFNMICSKDPSHKWVARMFWELGGWFFYDDDDSVCPTCGSDHDNADHGTADEKTEKHPEA